MTTAQTQIAEGTQTAQAAAPVLTKQEIRRNALQAGPVENGERIAVVTKENDQFVATYAGIVIATVKRAEALAGLLIDHRYTQTAKWAGVTQLKFECDVPEGTPFKTGMSKKAGMKNAVLAEVIAKIAALNLTDEAELKKRTKADLATVLEEIKGSLAAM